MKDAATPYTLPPQIQAQADAMEAFDAQVLADRSAADTETPPAPAPIAEPPVQAQAPATAPTPAPPASEPWEQRYRSLQGMFEQQSARLAAAEAKLAAPAPAPAPETPKPSAVTQADTEAFGGDLVDLIKRQATEIAHDLVTPIQAKLDEALAENARIKGTVETVAGHQTATSESNLIAALAKEVPGWEAQNTDAGFLAWLAETDPLSGLVRQEYMNRATSTFNVTQTVSLFKAWPGHVDAAPAATAPDPAPPAPPAPKPSVTPPANKADNPPSTPPEIKSWSQAEIGKFYDDVGRGAYRNDPAEQARIEAEIDLAVQNNRLKP